MDERSTKVISNSPVACCWCWWGCCIILRRRIAQTDSSDFAAHTVTDIISSTGGIWTAFSESQDDPSIRPVAPTVTAARPATRRKPRCLLYPGLQSLSRCDHVEYQFDGGNRQWRRQDLLRGRAKLEEIRSWVTHGKLQGRVQQLLDD